MRQDVTMAFGGHFGLTKLYSSNDLQELSARGAKRDVEKTPQCTVLRPHDPIKAPGQGLVMMMMMMIMIIMILVDLVFQQQVFLKSEV